MKDETKYRRASVVTVSMTGPLWLIGWLFSIGFVKLSFWKAVLALIIWPYYLGSALAG